MDVLLAVKVKDTAPNSCELLQQKTAHLNCQQKRVGGGCFDENGCHGNESRPQQLCVWLQPVSGREQGHVKKSLTRNTLLKKSLSVLLTLLVPIIGFVAINQSDRRNKDKRINLPNEIIIINL